LFGIGSVDVERTGSGEVIGVPRRERPLESQDTAVLRFAADLRQLREKAGSPTYREMSRRAHYSPAALSEAAGGRKLPSLAVTMAYVTACGGDPADWRSRWQEVIAESNAGHQDPPLAEDDQPAPYVGLAAFQPADADWFFGRDEIVDDLLAKLRERHFLGVFGASGSGKSSVLRAGLVARARTTGLSDNGPQPTLLFTPGPHPLEECAVALASYTGESATVLRKEFAGARENLHLRVRQVLVERQAVGDMVLVIDQFEEVFTLCADDEERELFIASLVFAATTPTSRVRVVLGLRADFYGHCGEYPDLVAALRDAQILVGAMTTDELREAVTGPASAAAAMVESALVTRLITDANGQPGVLPLVSHALLETWRRRRGANLTLAGYEAAGGIQHAIARTAEHVYTTLTTAQQATAKQIFLRLTALGETAEDTKRRVNRRELDNDSPDTLVVLEELAHARLVVLDQDSVDIAHEALIRHWPRLREWLTEDREGLRIHRQLTDATHSWESVDRDPGALYRGARLAIANDLATRNPALTTRERDFLHASTAVETSELATARRRTRRLRRLVALLATLLLVAGTTTVLAVRAQDSATQQRNVAIARKVVSDAAALRATNPALALQLGLAAYRLAPVRDTRDNLLSTFATPYVTRLTGHTNAVRSVTVSPDGHLLATGSWDRTARLWDVSDIYHPTALATITGHTGEVESVTFSPDGHTLATGGSDKTLRLWDVTDGRHPRRLATITTGHTVYSATFGAGGHVLAAGEGGHVAQLWDVADARHPTELSTLPDHTAQVLSVAFSPDGHTLATASADRTARLWDLTDVRHPREYATLTGDTDIVWALVFSPDGRTLATASWDHTARLWDVSDPVHAHESATLTGHTDAIYALAFSPDGHTLATAGGDNTTRLWNVADPYQPSELPALTANTTAVFAVAFSPDGRTLVTAGEDAMTRLVRLSDIVPVGRTDAVNAVAFSPDGRLLATADNDHTTRLVDVSDTHHPQELTIAADHDAAVSDVAFSPDGRTLATASSNSDDGQNMETRLWDMSDPRHPGQLDTVTSHDSTFYTVAFSPDGHTLATGGSGAAAITRLWDVSEPRHRRELTTLTGKPGDIIFSVAFGQDGRLLATGSHDGTVQLWDVSDARHPRELATLTGHTDVVTSVAFSPDGHTLATASADTARLWDVSDTRHPRELATLTGHTDVITTVAFSPDGHTLATAGYDKTARMWDVSDTRHPRELATLTGHTDAVLSVRFSADGHTLATGSEDHTVRLWDTDPERVATRICDVASPPITRTEWDQYFPGLDYTPPCPRG
jgi:WD40 repeat protein/energy-coupling factor transporter ATP-binding protein EcfA2